MVLLLLLLLCVTDILFRVAQLLVVLLCIWMSRVQISTRKLALLSARFRGFTQAPQTSPSPNRKIPSL